MQVVSHTELLITGISLPPFFRNQDLSDLQIKSYSLAFNPLLLLPRVISFLHKQFFTETPSPQSIAHQIYPKLCEKLWDFSPSKTQGTHLLFMPIRPATVILKLWMHVSLKYPVSSIFYFLIKFFWTFKVPPEYHGIVCCKVLLNTLFL